MKSSNASQISKPPVLREAFIAAAALSILVTICALWAYQRGYLLYYGDAQAHLNISRSVVDSHTPGYDQLGTVWLPMLHVLCLPFVRNSILWSTGLAGTIPVALCFVVAGVFFFLSARLVYESSLAASVVLACFALNPNVLYLAVIPMTEVVFFSGLAVLLYAECWFASTARYAALVLGIFASCWMSLTRYDGWFLIPFAALWFARSAPKKHRLVFLCFVILASLAPLYWVAHSWWETGNPIDFFTGPYSAKVIQGGKPYPGFHEWRTAFLCYGAAGLLCSGWGLLVAGVAGLALCRTGKMLLPSVFLLFPCLFYVWSIHSSGNPIHVPLIWPFTYYNTRYGLAIVAFAAFAAGAIIPAMQESGRQRLAIFVPLLAVAPWLVSPTQNSWICWKESQINSLARRVWTREASTFMKANYQPGDGVVAPFGDLTGIFCRLGLNLDQVLHEGNGAYWLTTMKRPDLIHQQVWAIAQEGDILDRSLVRSSAAPYFLLKQIQVPHAPTLNIYRRGR